MKKIEKLTHFDITKVAIPSSKSYLNRALIIASCVNGTSVLQNVQYESDDVQIMIKILQQIGVKVIKTNKTLIINGTGGVFTKPQEILDCGIAGTVARFVVALSTIFNFSCTITAEGKMLTRPMQELFEVLEKQLQNKFEYIKQKYHLPIRFHYVQKAKLAPEIYIDCSKSSQFLTALMMIAPILKVEKINIISSLTSQSYINITIDIMAKFGVKVENHDYKSFTIYASQAYKNCEYQVEPDYSSLSYFIALNYLVNKRANNEYTETKSVQGDARFSQVISLFTNHNSTKGILEFNMSQMPDTSMTAMIIAAFMPFDTRITGLATLKDKECNRLQAMQNEFRKINIKTEISQNFDSIIIYGNSNLSLNKQIKIETYKDHRIAMCFAVLGAITGNIVIQNPDVVSKSFVNFWQVFDSLYV
jgi:3-phosphoshikimate 1-carboxyvinyltransferase